MADRQRGKRKVEDTNSDEFEAEELDAELDDELDEDELDEDFDEDDAPASTRRRATAGAGARSGTAAKVRVRERDGRPGFFGRILNFIREIFAELQKVIWPTRKELLTYTSVVIVFVAIMMAFVAGLDVGFARLMFLVFGHA